MRTAPGGYSAAERLRRGGRAEVRAALVQERVRTLALVRLWREALGPGLRVPRQPGLNPPLWEWGHLAWFQEWWVGRNRQLARGVACDPRDPREPSSLPRADEWYDSSRVAHATRWELPLPSLDATLDWLEAALAATLARLEACAEDDHALYFFRLVALHEAMHAEASCYMARALGIAVPVEAESLPPAQAIQVPAQPFVVGWRGPGFAFDNELPPTNLHLPAFEIDAAPVRWSQFAAFVAASGYQQARWWTEEGWRWRLAHRREPPAMGARDEPAVHLSAHEAQAWCRWAGRRLPSEAEWECAALTAAGFRWGQVWEWTASPFEPYAGFEPHPYRDYSQPWFGTHRVLRGASAATSERLAHPRYRNFYEPHRTDILAGFRSCADEPAAPRV